MSKYQPYPAYKDSGIEWLGDVPEHWLLKRLKFNFKLQTNKVEINGQSVIALENIESWSGKFISSESAYQGQDVEFKKGDILFGKLRPYLAKVYKCESTGVGFGDILVYRPNSDIDSNFGFYMFLNEQFINLVDGSTYGTKMPRASSEFIGEMPLSTPPREEQTAIANFLDQETGKMDLLIKKQQAMIALLKEKRQAVISHAVTKGIPNQNRPNTPMKDSGIKWLGQIPESWKLKELKYLARVNNGKDQKEVLDDLGEFPVYGSGGIFGYANQYLFDGISVLLGRKGTVDKPLLVNGKFWTVDTMYWTKLKSNICPQWFYYCCLTIPFKFYQYGSALPSMTQEALHNHKFAVPKLQEQKEIAFYLDNQTQKIDTLIEKSQQAIALLKERKTALISAAVTGKIDVRGVA